MNDKKEWPEEAVSISVDDLQQAETLIKRTRDRLGTIDFSEEKTILNTAKVKELRELFEELISEMGKFRDDVEAEGWAVGNTDEYYREKLNKLIAGGE